MNVRFLVGVLRARAELRSHDRWSRDTLLEHQARSLRELRHFSVAYSPFYRELHAGLDDAPLEDLVIAEIVDEDNRPVEPGELGAKLLVTVLFSRTQPLLRYEMSDRVKALDGACPDGLPYALIGGVEGREEEVLTLAGVTVHPNVFHRTLECLDVAGWQVIDERGRLRVLLARPAPGVDPAVVGRAIASALEEIGVRGVAIEAEAVDAIPRTVLGKAPLIRHARPELEGVLAR